MTRPMACWVYRSGETVALATRGSITELAPFVKWRGKGGDRLSRPGRRQEGGSP